MIFVTWFLKTSEKIFGCIALKLSNLSLFIGIYYVTCYNIANINVRIILIDGYNTSIIIHSVYINIIKLQVFETFVMYS